MGTKKRDTDFWARTLDRRQMLKTLGWVGSVMALDGPSGLAQAMGQRQAGSGVEPTEPAAGSRTTTGAIPTVKVGGQTFIS